LTRTPEIDHPLSPWICRSRLCFHH